MKKISFFILMLFVIIAYNFLYSENFAQAVEYKTCCVCESYDISGMTDSVYSLPGGSTVDEPIVDVQKCDENDAYAVSCEVRTHPECGPIKTEMTKLADEFKFKDVVLGIAIPSLKFSPPPTKVDSEGNIYIPWMAEYIKAIYNFAVVAISVVAVVIIIIAGAQIIVSAGGQAKAQGYKRLTQAVIGLFLAWGSYFIMSTINPNLTVLKSLKVAFIPRKDITGTEEVGPSASKEEILAIIKTVSGKTGVDECILETIVAKESGFRSNRIGHDEDVPRTQVGSRIKFIKTGTRYGGATFEPSPKYYTDKNIKNDDSYNPGKPPDYGLDPRFTHGGGLGQFTVLINKSTGEMTRCPDGNIGRTIGSKCYNFPELMEPNTAVELSAELIKKIGTDNVEKLFYRYAGKGCSARVSQCRKMKAYAQCKEDMTIAQYEVPGDCTVWLKESFANCTNASYRNPTSQPTPDDKVAEKEAEQMVDEETGQSIQNY